MARKSYTPEQIINKLREAEILLSQDNTLAVVWERLGLATAPTTVGVESTVACVLSRQRGSRIWRKRMAG